MAKKVAKSKEAQAAAPEQEIQSTTNEIAAEIPELSPEQYELALTEKISSEVRKFNFTDQKLAELKEKYSGIKVSGPDDKENLSLLKEGLSVLTKVRTGAEKKRKELGEDYRKVVDGINKEGNRIIEAVKEIEAPLRQEDARIKEEIEAQKRKEEEEAQQKLNERVDKIKAAGMAFDGNFYSIANMSMDISTLKQMSDSDFLFLIAKVEMEATRIRKEEEEAARIEQERLEQERIKREEFEQEQEKLRLQQEEFKAQQEAFRKQQEEFEAQKRRAQEEEEERLREAAQARRRERILQIEALGFSFSLSQNKLVYANEGGMVAVGESFIAELTPEQWNEALIKLKDEITQIDSDYEKILLERKAQAEKEAAERERQRLEAEKEAERKRAELEEQEKIKLEKEKAEREAKRQAELPDLQKVYEYMQKLREVPQPAVSTEEANLSLEAANHFINEVLDSLKTEISEPGE